MTVVWLFTDIRRLNAALFNTVYKKRIWLFSLNYKNEASAEKQVPEQRRWRFTLFEILVLNVNTSRKWPYTGSDKSKFKLSWQNCLLSRSKQKPLWGESVFSNLGLNYFGLVSLSSLYIRYKVITLRLVDMKLFPLYCQVTSYLDIKVHKFNQQLLSTIHKSHNLIDFMMI